MFNIESFGKKAAIAAYSALEYEKMEALRDQPIRLDSVAFSSFSTEDGATEKAAYIAVTKADGTSVHTMTTSKSLYDVLESILINRGFQIETGVPYSIGEWVKVTLIKARKSGRTYNAFVNCPDAEIPKL